MCRVKPPPSSVERLLQLFFYLKELRELGCKKERKLNRVLAGIFRLFSTYSHARSIVRVSMPTRAHTPCVSV